MTLLHDLARPTPSHSLKAFRVGFGLLMAFASLRFFLYGWIDSLYIQPSYHFSYLLTPWIQPHPYLHLQFAFCGLCGLTIALGWHTRTFSLLFALSFAYLKFLDKTLYLNHDYLIALIALLLAVLPHRTTPTSPHTTPLYTLLTLRTQAALVYIFAALAKVHTDWLFHAQPLHTWLSTHPHAHHLPSLFQSHTIALCMSWGGFLYDLSIPFLLLFKPTRSLAFFLVCSFHIITWILFPIGIFPWVMILISTLFFDPSWPKHLLHSIQTHPKTPKYLKKHIHSDPPSQPPSPPHPSLHPITATLIALYLTLQLLLPLRHLAYPGDPNWTEQGFRFAWRVMLVEKTGLVEFEVHTENPTRTHTIYPHRELTPLQTRMMSTQPDMIHQYAHHIAQRMRKRGLQNPRVYAHTRVSFNTRPSQPLIDPTADLAAVPLTLKPLPFILPNTHPNPTPYPADP